MKNGKLLILNLLHNKYFSKFNAISNYHQKHGNQDQFIYARKNNESSMKRKALIIGVNSQDGSYLADLLHSKKYKIFGTVRNLNNLKKVIKNRQR